VGNETGPLMKLTYRGALILYALLFVVLIWPYWLTFPMFPAVWCWAAAALWSVTRLAKCPDILGWGVLIFSSYSLLMTAYPQPVVFHAYLLGGYGLWLAFHQLRISWLALAETDHGWQAAQSVEVNGVFQGVLLPQDTRRVRLEFKPLARYAWIAYVFWLLLLLLAGFKSW
jgi:hypothetical protein